MDRVDIKTTENQLKQEFIQGYGYPPRIAEALVGTVMDRSSIEQWQKKSLQVSP